MNNKLFPVIGQNEKVVQLALNYHEKIKKYTLQSEFKQARKLMIKLIDLGKDEKYLPALIMGYIHLSNQESNLLQFQQSLEHGLEALELSRNVNDDYISSGVFLNLGLCFGKAGDIDKSLEYSLKSLEYKQDDGKVLNNIGIVYKQKKQYDQALNYFQKAVKFFQKENHKIGISSTLINIGGINSINGSVDEAISAYQKALQIGIEIKSSKLIGRSHFSLGEVYLHQKKYDKAKKFFQEALHTAERTHDKQLISICYNNFSLLYKEKNEYQKALEYQMKYTEILEINSEEETKDKINKIMIRSEIEKNEQEEKQQQLQKSKQEIEKKFHYLQTAYAEIKGVNNFGVFSDKMQNVVKMAELLHSDRSVPVLIEGETGTGKEIIARIIHFGKTGKSLPFIIVNCAAISPTLFESELFGYEEGAFTGSRKEGMVGKFEMAQGGTVFLDEIGELPMELQPKLLRVLQQREIYRIGGKKCIKLDIRIICATNRDLKTEIDEKRFRNDLYFRLNTGRIFIPPLKERKEEIAPLAQMFLLSFSHKKKRDFKYIGKPALELLEYYPWPGNVRELENAIERVTLLYNDFELKPFHLNFLELSNMSTIQGQSNVFIIDFLEEDNSLSNINKEVITRVVDMFDGNKTKAANYLKISRTTVHNFMKK